MPDPEFLAHSASGFWFDRPCRVNVVEQYSCPPMMAVSAFTMSQGILIKGRSDQRCTVLIKVAAGLRRLLWQGRRWVGAACVRHAAAAQKFRTQLVLQGCAQLLLPAAVGRGGRCKSIAPLRRYAGLQDGVSADPGVPTVCGTYPRPDGKLIGTWAGPFSASGPNLRSPEASPREASSPPPPPILPSTVPSALVHCTCRVRYAIATLHAAAAALLENGGQGCF